MMGRIISTDAGVYVSPDPAARVVSCQGDVLDLLALCGEAGTDRLLFPQGSLAEAFFDLSTGLAGEITLKLSTYRVKAAIVVDLDQVPSRYFKDWAGECNRGKEIRFCTSFQDAVEWLLA